MCLTCSAKKENDPGFGREGYRDISPDPIQLFDGWPGIKETLI